MFAKPDLHRVIAAIQLAAHRFISVRARYLKGGRENRCTGVFFAGARDTIRVLPRIVKSALEKRDSTTQSRSKKLQEISFVSKHRCELHVSRWQFRRRATVHTVNKNTLRIATVPVDEEDEQGEGEKKRRMEEWR